MATTLTQDERSVLPASSRPKPALYAGARMGPDEFMELYEASPGVKAELINGVVYISHDMGSPVRSDVHGFPLTDLLTWLNIYRISRTGLRVSTDSTVFINDDRVQPDAFLYKVDGDATLGDDGYVRGAPELVCEIAASTARRDAIEKAEAYADAGALEYILWQTEADTPRLDWHVLRRGRYEELTPDQTGILTSTVFPGLRLDRPALLRGDMAAVLAALRT